MADREIGRSGESAAAVMDNAPLSGLCRSVDSSPQLPVHLPDMKIEMVKMEDVEHDGIPELGDCHQGIPRVLTAADVAMEKVFDNEVDSKSQLAFVVGQGRFACSVCKESFMSEDGLFDHVYRECGVLLEMKCTKCSFRSEFVDDMRSHLELKHKDFEEPKSKCDIKHTGQYCDHETKRQSDLVRHLQVHSVQAGDRPACTGCRKSFKTNDNLKKHVKYCEMWLTELTGLKCKFCNFESKMRADVSEHMRRVHPGETIDPVTCRGCGKSFKNKNSLKNHIRFCDRFSDKILKFKCFHCSHETKWKKDLEIHIRCMHPIGPLEPATCSACGRTYKHQVSLKKHLKRCEESNAQIMKYKCFYCSHETKWKGHLPGHIRSKHPVKGMDRPSCRGCRKLFKNKGSLRKHIKLCPYLKHKCPFCNHETNWLYHLKQHIETQHPTGPIERPVCSGCGKSYKHRDRLRKHRPFCAKFNNKIVKYQCFHCGHETTQKDYLKLHVKRIHFGEARYRVSCTECAKPLRNKLSLKKHMKYCGLSSGVMKFKCKLCNHETKRAYALRKHVETQHPVGPIERVVCSGCGKSYKHQDRLKRHIPFCEKFNNEIVKFKCYHCCHETTHKGYLKDHIKRVHPVDGIEHVTCHGCGKYFKNKANLKKHMKYCDKLNTDVVKLKCEFCNFTTKRPYYLKKHMETPHVVESTDRAVCSGCGKSYKHYDRLRKHIPFCEKSNNKIVKFKCYYCYHETTRKSYLRDHIRRLHPVDWIDRPTCTACGKSYKSKVYLKKHMKYCEKLNGGVMKLKCEFCDHETKWIGDLRKHIKTQHSVEKTDRVTCGGCGKSFKNKESLTNHMRYCEQLNNEVMKLKCKYCDHETKRQGDMTRHIVRLHYNTIFTGDTEKL